MDLLIELGEDTEQRSKPPDCESRCAGACGGDLNNQWQISVGNNIPTIP